MGGRVAKHLVPIRMAPKPAAAGKAPNGVSRPVNITPPVPPGRSHPRLSASFDALPSSRGGASGRRVPRWLGGQAADQVYAHAFVSRRAPSQDTKDLRRCSAAGTVTHACTPHSRDMHCAALSKPVLLAGGRRPWRGSSRGAWPASLRARARQHPDLSPSTGGFYNTSPRLWKAFPLAHSDTSARRVTVPPRPGACPLFNRHSSGAGASRRNVACSTLRSLLAMILSEWMHPPGQLSFGKTSVLDTL